MSVSKVDLEEGMVPVEVQAIVETSQENKPASSAGAFKPKYTHYKPSGQTLVGQLVNPLFSWDRWTLTAYHDVHFVKEEWVEITVIHNNTDEKAEEERTYELGTTVTQGSEKVNSVSASAGFSGWGFSLNVGGSSESKTFQSIEVSEKTTHKRNIVVPANKSYYIYQKVFTFRLSIFFVWRDSQQFGGRELTYSGSSSWADTVVLECVQTVKCDEICWIDHKIEVGETTVTIPKPPRREAPSSIFQWGNMNDGSKLALATNYPGAPRG
ncbi:hypothetical protein J4E91_009326 [Alternaria rosae]|nr:hypothetical protein J4E91_009326 [Alternaria rosae]